MRTKLADFFNILQVDYGWDTARRQACRRDIADLFSLPPPGFLWYGHRIVQLVEDLAHAAE
jgi:hypothetical protein